MEYAPLVAGMWPMPMYGEQLSERLWRVGAPDEPPVQPFPRYGKAVRSAHVHLYPTVNFCKTQN